MKKDMIPSPEMFRILIDQNIFGIAIIQNDKLVFINQKGLEITGFPAEELEKMNQNIFYRLIHPDDVEYVKEQNRKKQGVNGVFGIGENEGIRTNYVYRIITKSGSIKWIKLFSDSIQHNNKPAEMGVFTDITDSKNKENELICSSENFQKALDESESRYKVVNELIVSFAYCFKVLPGGNIKSEWVVGAFYELTGYSVVEVKQIGGWESLIYPEDFPIVEKQLESLLSGKEATMEYRIVTSDGSTRWVKDYAMAKFDKEDKHISKIYGAVQDITESKRIENEYLQMQKQESLGLFAGGIAHDFNNILTTILGGASLAKFKMDDKKSINRILTDIERASLHARDLTHKLITYARGGKPVKRTYDIRNIVIDTVNFVLTGSNIVSDFSFPELLGPVQIDKGQISQVIQNLVINGMQAMSAGGTITITVEEKELLQGEHQLESGIYVKVSIKDSGSGIPEEIKPRIFDPYFTTKESGHGIGLSTCYSIMKSHKGHIGFTSEPGSGTEFYILLPVKGEKSSHKLKKHSSQAINTLGKKILVVDDEENINKITGNMLGKMGIQVYTANKSQDALGLYKRHYKSKKPIDIVLLDLLMPGDQNGVQILGGLQKINPEVKAVIMSGCVKDPVLEKFSSYGFKGVIRKPFTIQELYGVLEKLD